MTYQPPYTPQYYQYPGHNPADVLLGPARRAGILLLVLGGLGLLLGGCIAGMAALLPNMMDQMPSEQLRMFNDLEAQAGVKLPIIFYVLAGIFGAIALLYILLGILCRGGGIVAQVIALVVAVLALLYFAVSSILSLAAPGGALGACMGFLICGPHVLLIVWLIQGIRNHSQIGQLQMQQQMQAWQYQQQMRTYGTGGYSYGQQQPPPSAPQQ